jgi:prepilin-type N-terminal cleavage/methylation domain-containing protein/prepilin-type processing-associated H-X9-DG protein
VALRLAEAYSPAEKPVYPLPNVSQTMPVSDFCFWSFSLMVSRFVKPRHRGGFTLVELLVVIAIIGILVGLLLPAVQAAREAARRMSCSNNMKQIGMAVHNHESAYKRLPYSGQCGSTGSNTTAYMIHSVMTTLLPYIEQGNVYNMFDHNTIPWTAYGATASGTNFLAPTGALIHRNAKGRAFNDVTHPSGQLAAQTSIPTYVCPSTPLDVGTRDPIYRLGGNDYMFIDLSDVDTRPGSPTFGARTPSSDPQIADMRIQGMLDCESSKMAATTDGTAYTLLSIEDAGRAHPNVSKFGALSTRTTPVPSSTDAFPIAWSGGTASGRMMYAWADPDSVTNGYSGPSNAIAPGLRTARINNYGNIIGGPVECRWTVNNCGPNDEPYAWHGSGANAAFGDGSVRFLAASTDGIILKWMVGRNDAQSYAVEE